MRERGERADTYASGRTGGVMRELNCAMLAPGVGSSCSFFSHPRVRAAFCYHISYDVCRVSF